MQQGSFVVLLETFFNSTEVDNWIGIVRQEFADYDIRIERIYHFFFDYILKKTKRLENLYQTQSGYQLEFVEWHFVDVFILIEFAVHYEIFDANYRVGFMTKLSAWRVYRNVMKNGGTQVQAITAMERESGNRRSSATIERDYALCHYPLHDTFVRYLEISLEEED